MFIINIKEVRDFKYNKELDADVIDGFKSKQSLKAAYDEEYYNIF